MTERTRLSGMFFLCTLPVLLVFLLIFIPPNIQLIIPKQYLNTRTANSLISVILFLGFSSDLSIIINLIVYSFFNISGIYWRCQSLGTFVFFPVYVVILCWCKVLLLLLLLLFYYHHYHQYICDKNIISPAGSTGESLDSSGWELVCMSSGVTGLSVHNERFANIRQTRSNNVVRMSEMSMLMCMSLADM
jgi:hypothetical protein